MAFNSAFKGLMEVKTRGWNCQIFR